MTTAFVLSGGGSLGAVQVGMLAALGEQDIRPDVLIGTSAGALNAVYIASRGFNTETIAGLADIWRGLRRQQVFPVDPLRQTLALVGRRPSLYSMRPLRRIVETHLAVDNLEDTRIPVHVVATDALSGEEVILSDGDAVAAVLASAAIPAVFRPVERDGRLLVDGAVSNNTAVSRAVEFGADRIVIIPAGSACALSEAPKTPLAAATHALTLLLEQRLIVEVAHLAEKVEILVAPPLCPLSVGPTDFTHADELIARAHDATRSWFEAGNQHLPNPARFLSLHDHQEPPATPTPRSKQ